MTLLRLHCPVCETACQVSDAAAVAGTRCGRCGLLFVPKAAIRPGDASRRDVSEIRAGPASPAPQPPSVIYTNSAPREPPPDVIQPVHPASGPGLHRSPFEVTPDTTPGPSALNAGGEKQPEGDAMVDRAAVPMGPPPQYRPIVTAPPQAKPRVEMAPVTPAAPVNIRGIGALGPPPPYWPIVQASQVFGRGPPPDLEPWRIASLTHAIVDRGTEPEPPLADVDPSEADWTISREPEPVVEMAPPPVEETRFEIDDEGHSLAWPTYAPPPMPMPGSGSVRAIRLTLWAAGIALAVLGLGAALYFEWGEPDVGWSDGGLWSNRSRVG